MAQYLILFHSDRKKAEIYNSLHLGKSKKKKKILHTVPKTEIKPLTSNQSVARAKRIIPPNRAIKVKTTLTVINNENCEPPVNIQTDMVDCTPHTV